MKIAYEVLFACPPRVKQAVVLERKGLAVGNMNPCIRIAEKPGNTAARFSRRDAMKPVLCQFADFRHSNTL